MLLALTCFYFFVLTSVFIWWLEDTFTYPSDYHSNFSHSYCSRCIWPGLYHHAYVSVVMSVSIPQLLSLSLDFLVTLVENFPHFYFSAISISMEPFEVLRWEQCWCHFMYVLEIWCRKNSKNMQPLNFLILS